MDIVIVVSDTHIGSTVGLCPPLVNLDDGGTYKASTAQRWLWECWLKFSSRVKTIADANHGATVNLVVNGDAIEGDTKKRSNQVITRNRANILSLATDTLKPLVDISTRAFFIRGTAAHVGKSAELEEELASDCTITEPASDSVSSWWELSAEFSGVRFDISHHGRVGGMPWTRANPLGTLIVRTTLAYLEMGQPAPHVVVRSHNHKYASSGDNYPMLAVATPAWQLATEYTHKLGIPEPADIGGVIFTCDKGEYTWEKAIYHPKPKKIWKSPKPTSGKR